MRAVHHEKPRAAYPAHPIHVHQLEESVQVFLEVFAVAKFFVTSSNSLPGRSEKTEKTITAETRK